MLSSLSVIVLNLHGTLTQDAGATFIHELSMLSFLYETFVCCFLCILIMILILRRIKVTNAEHRQHVIFRRFCWVFSLFFNGSGGFVLFKLVIFYLLLRALNLFVSACAPLLLL